jgi:hypothetical protein
VDSGHVAMHSSVDRFVTIHVIGFGVLFWYLFKLLLWIRHEALIALEDLMSKS